MRGQLLHDLVGVHHVTLLGNTTASVLTGHRFSAQQRLHRTLATSRVIGLQSLPSPIAASGFTAAVVTGALRHKFLCLEVPLVMDIAGC